jgi:hypothetical protein
MPDRCTPEYERVVAKMGASRPYRRTRALLSEFLPLDGYHHRLCPAQLQDEPISMAVTESTVQWLLHRRMNAQQHMRWSPPGAHLMLKVRTATANGTLERGVTLSPSGGLAVRSGARLEDPQGSGRSHATKKHRSLVGAQRSWRRVSKLDA